jgi:excisionase family DNA binding protein
MPGKLISTMECAKKKGIARQSVLHAIKRGDLPAIQVGRGYAIEEEDCEAYEPALEPQERAKRRWKKAEREEGAAEEVKE